MICTCCGSHLTQEQPVLWKALIDEWRLAEHEVAYINRQQGFYCTACSSNMRCMALAKGIMNHFGYKGIFRDFVHTSCAKSLRVYRPQLRAA